jgi:hypothetical protein
MKKILLIALVAAAITLGFLYRQQTRETAAKEAETAAAKRELAEAEAEAERREQRNQSEQARLSAANAQLAEKVARVTRSEPASTTNPPSQGPSADATKPKHPMAEMLRDPDMKEVFRKQARESVARGVKELVSTNLVQQLGLTKEQTVELKKLLTQKGTLGFDFMMPVMTGELDEAGLAELGRKTKADMSAITDELKTLLGEDDYKMFEAHEKTQPDRDRLDRFAARLKETGQGLSPDQRDQLLAAMAEERNNFRFAVDYNDTSQIDYEHFHDFYSEDKMNNYFQEMEQLNDRILQRAQAILPAGQAAELQEVLKLQLQKGKYVVKSTNAMLGKNAGR